MLAIKNNLMASNAARYLGMSYDALATSVERLSSGQRINSASDDAAGMAVRELMRANIAVLQQGARNAQDGVSMLQTMEGALQVIDNLLVRMQQLAEQAATGSYSSTQRVIMDNEFSEMASEITRIAESTDFNGIKMLDNSATVSVHFGVETDKIDVTGAKMDASSLGVKTLSITSDASARSALTTLTANLTANLVRNLWTHSVIMCGHFPEGVQTFAKDSIEGETRGQWYLRQMLGSANISGGPAMHFMTGNLSYQIEHHLFPDLPSNRYQEIAPKVQEIFQRLLYLSSFGG